MGPFMSEPEEKPEEVEITGADSIERITGLDDDPGLDVLKRERASAQRGLAFTLVWIMAGTVVGHYATCAGLLICKKPDAAEALARLFNSWLPLISGLASSAVTYYFTKER